MREIFFQTSLPRAGSTLLQNIMGQNPDFYVTPTSGVLELLFAARAQYTNSAEFKAQDQDLMKKGWLNFCFYGLHGFFDAITDKKYVLDKSRGWGVHYDWVNRFMGQPKMIIMVRDSRAIYASMEKNFRKDPEKAKDFVNWGNGQGTNIEKRVEHWASGMPVGVAFTRLKEIFDRGFDEHMLFIRYEDLCVNPANEIDKVYDFLGVPKYDGHNFKNVEQLTQEDDTFYGPFGDHSIREGEIKELPKDYNEILTRPIADKVYNSYPWFNELFNYSY
jgi:sulfotransferase